MKITAELSFYPLEGEAIERIVAFIRTLGGHERLEIVVNQMSTQLRGELRDVFAAVEQALEASFGAGGTSVLVAKFLNADLPIADPPPLPED